MKTLLIALISFSFIGSSCAQKNKKQKKNQSFAVVKTDAEWKKQLTAEQFQVARKAGTEAPYTGKFWDNYEKGMYTCSSCAQELFSSETKFESGTGWPSFWKPLKKQNVIEKNDGTLGMARTEVICSRCGAHLGHVFDDGPKPTGLRYCMNSASLDFVKAK
jgi:peptide-methionine (R)-S-oxide reductase